MWRLPEALPGSMQQQIAIFPASGKKTSGSGWDADLGSRHVCTLFDVWQVSGESLA